MPSPLTHDEGKRPETLYVTDAEAIRRLGIPIHQARRLIRQLDKYPSGFPPKDRLCGNLRYWPAVQQFFANRTAKMLLSQRRTA